MTKSPLLVTHYIRYALCISTLLYSSCKRNCLLCFLLSSPNKVQCILCKVLWILKLCQGKTQQSFTGDKDSFLSGGHVFVSRSSTESWRSLSKWCNCNFSNTGKRCRRRSDSSTNKPKGNMLTCRLKSNGFASKRTGRHAGPRAMVPRASGKATGRHESHASTPCKSSLVGPGHTPRNNFGDGYFYFRAVERLLVAVSHLYESSCCSRWPKGSGFSHQPVVNGQGRI